MLTIGKLAALAKTSTDTLRYYEREGLIEPADRTESGYRLYNEDSTRRLRFIRRAQHCGFTLAEIRDLLTLHKASCCGDVRRHATEKKLQLERKMKTMKSMAKALDQLIARPADVAVNR